MVALTIKFKKGEVVLDRNKPLRPLGDHGNHTENATSSSSSRQMSLGIHQLRWLILMPQLFASCTFNEGDASFITNNLFIHNGICLRHRATISPLYPWPLEIQLKRLAGLNLMDGSIKQQKGRGWWDVWVLRYSGPCEQDDGWLKDGQKNHSAHIQMKNQHGITRSHTDIRKVLQKYRDQHHW